MSELLIDEPATGIRRLLINRPDARNAINAEVRALLFSALVAARDNPAIRAVILGGAGGIFCAGGDLPSMVGITADAARARMAEGHRIIALLWTFPKPVIAAVERIAAGSGAGIALTCDRIVIGRDASLLFPFLRLGLVPDWGLMQLVTRRAGLTRAGQIFLDGAALTGTGAVAAQLADLAVEAGDVMATALAEAQRLAALPPAAFALLKAGLRDAHLPDPLGLAYEADAQVACLTGPEFTEGYAAFREKRPPRFSGPA
jgi:2-(1,2-epoxy-1,2-dihydrophenyl)acetyl-CoA isomerase